MAALRPLPSAVRIKTLRNDRAQIAGKIHEQLLAALFGKEIDDAVDGLVGAVRVQRSQA